MNVNEGYQIKYYTPIPAASACVAMNDFLSVSKEIETIHQVFWLYNWIEKDKHNNNKINSKKITIFSIQESFER